MRIKAHSQSALSLHLILPPVTFFYAFYEFSLFELGGATITNSIELYLHGNKVLNLEFLNQKLRFKFNRHKSVTV